MNRLSYICIEGKKYPLCHCLRSEELLEDIWGSREALFELFGKPEEILKISTLKNIARGLVVMNNAALDYIELFNPIRDEDVVTDRLTDEHLLLNFSSNDGLYLMETYITAISVGAAKSADVEDSEKNTTSPQP